ncbi:MAG: hypothetical protein JSV81_14180 [Anaerolineales bacterium]|nr:MAG: hypothetical protein JSV81_14180 [Anaerolineales bacterium]
MEAPLLQTKLYIPARRPELVSRPRLIERLNAGLHRKLTLVSAPAGFGKTTLVSEWMHGCGRQVAWVSLDATDNDPVRFWSYVVAALQTIQKGTGEAMLGALRSPQPPPLESVLTVLINEIAAAPEHLALVLDDYHTVEAQAIHDTLTFLLDHLPPRLHLVIATRSDPPFNLSRLRGHGQLTELRQNDLRFTPEEVTQFLSQAMGLALRADQIAALATRTEGWIAGLQMVAASMRRRDDLTSFVQDFTGSNRYIMDYLVEEVFNRQTQSVQSFLLQTSILERLSGPLCDAVLGMSEPASQQVNESVNGHGFSSQSILERLEQANLFIVPLDDERQWYRYHHLFADLLRQRLERILPEQATVLHQRASKWYADNRLITEAVSHALASGDMKRAAQLVEEHSFAVMDRGELSTVVGWLDALPDDIVRSRPWLSVSRAWALMYSGQLDEVEPRLRDAENALDRKEENIEGYIAAIWAYVAASKGDAPQAIEFADQALKRLSPRDWMARSFTTAILSSLYRFSGDFVASTQAIGEAIAIGKAVGDSHMVILASCNMAGTLILQGQLRKAAATFRDTLRFAGELAGHRGRRLPFAGLACTGLATVLRQWNDLERAERLAREGVELSEQWGQAEAMMHGYVELAHVLGSRRDGDAALDAMQKAMRTTPDLSSWTFVSLEAAEARLHLRQGNLAAASRWMQESRLSIEDTPNFQQMLDYLTLARVLIAEKRFSEASGLLARLLNRAEPAGAMGYVIEILVLQAMVYQAQGVPDSALESLTQALTIAEPEGYVRIFADEGEPIATLLRRAAARGVAPEYVGRLLAATAATPPHSNTSTLTAQPLVDPLSERELEVLRLIAAGLSNQQIADELFLAVGTVKKHTHNIHSKLGVRSRTQAILRAKELQLIPH